MSRYLDELFSAYPVHLSVSNLAEVLGVTQKTAYEYLQSGDVPAYQIGTRWLILRDEVKGFVEMSSSGTRRDRITRRSGGVKELGNGAASNRRGVAAPVTP